MNHHARLANRLIRSTVVVLGVIVLLSSARADASTETSSDLAPALDSVDAALGTTRRAEAESTDEARRLRAIALLEQARAELSRSSSR